MVQLTPTQLEKRFDQEFADDKTLGDLAKAYCHAPIVLYTGSGVSVGATVEKKGHVQEYGLPTWRPVLKAVVRRAGGSEALVTSSDLWQAADEAVAACGLREPLAASALSTFRAPSRRA